MAKSIGYSAPKPTHKELALRARAIYEQKGKVPGHNLENWLEAEAQLMSLRNVNKQQRQETREIARLAAH